MRKRRRKGHFLVEVLDLGLGRLRSRGEEVNRLFHALHDAGYDISDREIEAWSTEQRHRAAVFSDAVMMGERMTRPEFIPDRRADWAKARSPDTPTAELIRLASSTRAAAHLVANPRFEELLSVGDFMRRARVDHLASALMSRGAPIPKPLLDALLSGGHLYSRPLEILPRLASYPKLELGSRRAALSSLPVHLALEAPGALEVEGDLEELGALLRRALRRWRGIHDVTPLEPREVVALVDLDGIGALVAAHLVEAPPDILTRLAEHDDASVRAGVAGNPSTPTAVLVTLSEEPWLEIQKAIVGNLAAPLVLIEDITLKVPPKLRGKWARSRRTNPMILRALVRDPVRGNRVWLARNDATPSETLHALCSDRSSKVRAALAERETIDAALLEQLSRDPSLEVLEALHRNGATPRRFREKALRALTRMSQKAQPRAVSLQPNR